MGFGRIPGHTTFGAFGRYRQGAVLPHGEQIARRQTQVEQRFRAQLFGQRQRAVQHRSFAVARQPGVFGADADTVRRAAALTQSPCGDEIHRGRADEPGHEPRPGLRIDLDRRADLVGHARVHHNHPVGHGHRFDLVVSNVERGHTKLPLQFADLDPHLHPQLGVEIGQRFVEQEHRRLAHDGAAHRDPLPLPAGQRARLAVEVVRQLQHLRRRGHAVGDFRLGHACDFQPIGHVVEHAHMRIERVVLEHHGDVAIHRLDLVHAVAADADIARRHGLQPCNHAQQRRFPATGWADDDDEFAIRHVDADAVNHLGSAK